MFVSIEVLSISTASLRLDIRVLPLPLEALVLVEIWLLENL